MRHETKTEYFKEDKLDKRTGIDKNIMTELLMKLELEKMGFKEKDYQAILREFLGKFTVEDV